MIFNINILAAAIVPLVISTAVNFALAYAAYWICAQIAGKNKLKMPEASNYPLQTAQKGVPKQKIYGTTRAAGEIIWLGDLHPYTVSHDSGGGKGGGGGGQGIESTNYKRSFLVSFGEGPLYIKKIWANDKLIYPVDNDEIPIYILAGAPTGYVVSAGVYDITIFAGLDNSGVPALTGEDYGEYIHDCLLFFNEYNLGTSTTLPNIVVEVCPKIENFFVGGRVAGGGNVLVNANIDNTLDTDWGSSGYWGYTDPDTGDKTVYCYNLLRCEDGGLFVIFNNLWLEAGTYAGGGKLCSLAKLDVDGALDTAWGYNGFYPMVYGPDQYNYPISTSYQLLKCNDGTYILFGFGSGSNNYCLHKISADGEMLAVREYNKWPPTATIPYIGNTYAACWSDDTKATLLIFSQASNRGLSGCWANVVALDPDNFELDDSWSGLMEYGTQYDGYGAFPSNSFGSIPLVYNIIPVSDGYILAHGVIQFSGVNYTLTKMKADWSGYDTDWGTNGHAKTTEIFGFGPPRQNQIASDSHDNIYTITSDFAANADIQYLDKFDSTGTLVNTKIFDSNGTNYVYQMVKCIENYIFLGTLDSGIAYDDIEVWDGDFNYQASFDILSSDKYVLLPDALEYEDKNPAEIIYDIVTNTRYGGRLSESLICQTCYEKARDYWYEKGILISPKINEARPWLDWVDYIFAHCGGFRHFDGGLFHIGAFMDEDAVFDLDDTDGDVIIQPSPDNPGPKVLITKRAYSDTYNRIEVVWTDRANNYGTAVAVAQDEVDQRISGQIRKKTVQLDAIHDEAVAVYMAQRLLIDSLYRFDILKFTVGYKNMLLEIGDVGTITEPLSNLDSKKIRIMQKDESEHGRNIEITAIEEYSHFYPENVYSTQENLRSEPADINLEDGTIYYREDPLENKMYLSIVPAGTDVNGWQIFISYDDNTYTWLGRCGISGVTSGAANSAGTIESNLPAHGSITWSKDEAVLVDIGTVTDLHTDISETQFWDDLRLAKIGDEIIAFKDAAEIGDGLWRISNLRRGMFGTEAVAHSSGETFCTLDKNFTWKFSESDIGKTVYFKALTFYGDIVQNIAAVSSFSVEIEGLSVRPAAAGLLRLSSDENEGGSGRYSGASFTLYWNLGSRVSGFNYGDWLNLPWNNYIADENLQAVVLKFETEAGAEIGQREIAAGSSVTITKATDLGGNDKAIIKVVPRRTYESKLENSILVESV